MRSSIPPGPGTRRRAVWDYLVDCHRDRRLARWKTALHCYNRGDTLHQANKKTFARALRKYADWIGRGLYSLKKEYWTNA